MKDKSELTKVILDCKCLGLILLADKHISNNKYEQQLSCLFHGPDNKPSARYYPNTDSLYCWKCQKKWDVFRYLWEMKGYDFFNSVEHLIKKFRIDISKVPNVEDKIKDKGVPFNRAEVKINNKASVLSALERKILQLKGKISFNRYNRMVFGFVLIKASVFNENFVKDCELLLKDMKEID